MRRLKLWKRGLVFAVALVAMGSLAMLDPAGAVDPAKQPRFGCPPANGCGIHMQGYPPPPADHAPPAMRLELPSGTVRVQAIEVEVDGQSLRIDSDNFGPLRELLQSLDPPTV